MAAISGERRLTVFPPAPKLRSSYAVDLIEGGAPAWDAFADEWRSLCTEGPSALPFLRPEWIAAYLAAVEPNAQVVTHTVRRRGRLVAVLPLIRDRTRFHGVPVTRLRPPAWPRWPDPFDIVHDDSPDGAAAVEKIWRSLAQVGGWDVLELADVAPGTAAERMAELADADGRRSARRPSRETPVVALPGPGGSFEATIAHINSKFRANVRRRFRNLEKLGQVELRRLERADPVWLDRFFRLEASGWKGREGSAIACDPVQRAYYAAVAEAAARHGYLSLYALTLNDEPIAMHFGLTIAGRYLVPKLAFDEAYREHAPGHLLVHEVLRDSVARGLVEFDFLGHAMPWKLEWASHVRSSSRCFVFGSGVSGRAAHLIRFQILPFGRRLHSSIGSIASAAGLHRSDGEGGR